MGEYFPLSPENKNAEEYNKNLPGLGGVFNSRNLQTYHYGANNPLKYKDPTGEVIILNNKNKADRQTLLNDINSMSVTQYKLSWWGFGSKLVVDKKATAEMQRKIANGEEVRSQSFTDDIELLRQSKENIYIKIAETEEEIDYTRNQAGGGYFEPSIYVKSGKAAGGQIVVDRDGRKFSHSPSSPHEDGSPRTRQDILLHEISGHAAPFMKHDADAKKGTEFNAIDIENERRKELGKSPRFRDENHHAYEVTPAE